MYTMNKIEFKSQKLLDYKSIITINNKELELANQYAKICRYVRVSVCYERYWTVFFFSFLCCFWLLSFALVPR